MKKGILLSIVFLFFSICAFAQKGNNQVSVGLDVGFPVGDFGESSNVGFGGTVKGMYGVGTAGQMELTLGYLGFSYKNNNSIVKASNNLFPILVGYRHFFDNIYVEPQLGLTVISNKLKRSGVDVGGENIGGENYLISTAAFGWAIGVGYLFDNFDFSIRYQSASKNGGSLGFFGLRVGYNFDININ